MAHARDVQFSPQAIGQGKRVAISEPRPCSLVGATILQVVLVPGRIVAWSGQIAMIDAARLVVSGGVRNFVSCLLAPSACSRALRAASVTRYRCRESTRFASSSAPAPICGR